MSKRTGATLVEVLLVAGILAALVGLLLPAIQAVRQSAARARSANQLRQVVLALHNYVSVHADRLPYDGMIRVTRVEPDSESSEPITVFEAVRELVGDQSMARRRNVHAEAFGGYTYDYTFLVNPADPSYGHYPVVETDPHVRGTSSFASNPHALPRDGRFASMYPDGASNTSVFTERYARCGTATGRTNHLWELPRQDLAGQPIYNWRWPASKVFDRAATFADPYYDDRRPGQPGVDVLAPFQLAPAVANCDGRIPQSPHRTLSLAMADGSVRAVAGSVRPAVFWAAVTPAGGECFGFDP
jgi:hypothetical protein